MIFTSSFLIGGYSMAFSLAFIPISFSVAAAYRVIFHGAYTVGVQFLLTFG
jgi:hypothetical protein